MTTLVCKREPTVEEKKNGAEIVFVRQDESGREYNVQACVLYESWEQWGVSTEILVENMPDIECWRRSLDDLEDC